MGEYGVFLGVLRCKIPLGLGVDWTFRYLWAGE